MAEGDEFTRQKFVVNNAPDVHFEGKRIGFYTTQSERRPKDRWTELALWETRGGAWIAEQVGRTSREGEQAIRDALVIENVDGDRKVKIDGQIVTREVPSAAAAREMVMQFFGWTIVAKAFAREMGWDVVRRID
ncbi:hypothetical protein [Sphingomonas panaciterrae]|uniref:hypothetical protein n=1 Tax=Sphingomonas panaciterrae TaxID=1462999 RepID=UPI002FF1B497